MSTKGKLFPAKRIVGESNTGEYEVEWEGLDPATGLPWDNSWVDSDDCSNDLKDGWKKKRGM